MKLNRRIVMVAGGIFLILFIFSGYWLLVGRKSAVSNKNGQVVTSEDVVLTVDSSVKVSLTPLSGRKEEILLSVKNIPKGTDSLQYILSYETIEGGRPGVDSTAEIVGSDFEKKITLGTCSSGACVYHNVKDKITLELLFIGDDGNKSFIKEYSI